MRNVTDFNNGFLFGEIDGYNLLKNLWSDIFEGQIIASLIIVLFLTIFLLREFIVQNARPGVLGDPVVVEAGPDGEEAAHAAPVEPIIVLDQPPIEPPVADPHLAMDAPASLATPENGGLESLKSFPILPRTSSEGEWSDVSEGSEVVPSDPEEAREKIRKQRERYFGSPKSNSVESSSREASGSSRDLSMLKAGPLSDSSLSSPLQDIHRPVAPLKGAIPSLDGRKRLLSISETVVSWGDTQKVVIPLVEPTMFDAAFPPKVVDPSVVPLPPSRSVSQIDFTGVVPKERRRRAWRHPGTLPRNSLLPVLLKL